MNFYSFYYRLIIYEHIKLRSLGALGVWWRWPPPQLPPASAVDDDYAGGGGTRRLGDGGWWGRPIGTHCNCWWHWCTAAALASLPLQQAAARWLFFFSFGCWASSPSAAHGRRRWCFFCLTARTREDDNEDSSSRAFCIVVLVARPRLLLIFGEHLRAPVAGAPVFAAVVVESVVSECDKSKTNLEKKSAAGDIKRINASPQENSYRLLYSP